LEKKCPEEIKFPLEGLINIGCDKEEIPKAKSFAEKYPNIWCALGYHPHCADNITEEDLKFLKELLQNSPKIVAVGECGLDYYKNFSSRESQRRIFIKQLEISLELNKPVVIHTREAEEDTIAILKDFGIKKAVLHCFSGGEKLLQYGLENNLYFSISGIITFKNAKKLREMVKEIPLDYLMVETDSPFLAPVPKRGKKNMPPYLYFTLKFLAEMLQIPIEDLRKKTMQNTKKFFNLELPTSPEPRKR
jgi:TatD DNase family protein